MKTILKSTLGTLIGALVFSGAAFAVDQDACGTLFPCAVPEPGTWGLVALGIAGALVVAKFGKKK